MALPYKQGVTGSNPVVPTPKSTRSDFDRVFCFHNTAHACLIQWSEIITRRSQALILVSQPRPWITSLE